VGYAQSAEDWEQIIFLTNPDLRWTALESGDIHHKSTGLKTVV